jgi:hypothetical protein
LDGVLCAADGVLNLALGLVRLAISLELGVACHLADRFLCCSFTKPAILFLSTLCSPGAPAAARNKFNLGALAFRLYSERRFVRRESENT